FLEIAARLADHAQYLAFERDFEDAAREGRLADEHHLVLAGRNADRVGCADRPGEALAGRRVAVGRARRRIRRNVDCEHAQELAFGVEHLDAPIGAIAHVDVVVAVARDGVRGTELPRTRSLLAPRLHPIAAVVDLGDTRVDVAIADIGVSLLVPGDVG